MAIRETTKADKKAVKQITLIASNKTLTSAIMITFYPKLAIIHLTQKTNEV